MPSFSTEKEDEALEPFPHQAGYASNLLDGITCLDFKKKDVKKPPYAMVPRS
jgi:hypothetical protein